MKVHQGMLSFREVLEIQNQPFMWTWEHCPLRMFSIPSPGTGYDVGGVQGDAWIMLSLSILCTGKTRGGKTDWRVYQLVSQLWLCQQRKDNFASWLGWTWTWKEEQIAGWRELEVGEGVGKDLSSSPSNCLGSQRLWNYSSFREHRQEHKGLSYLRIFGPER